MSDLARVRSRVTKTDIRIICGGLAGIFVAIKAKEAGGY